jgi:hypothetical protein|tara:strand:+ start:308 stop:544 length:237 start_codon:yes stop_codon:yes gene_type:complete
MEKTNLLTLQGNQEDLEQSVRYEYSQFYCLGLGTILLIIIYFYLSSLDKTSDTIKQQSIGCLLFIIIIIVLFYSLNYV